MESLVVVSWIVMATVSAAVIAVALGLWIRDIRRHKDIDGVDIDGVEPSPFSDRAALYMLLALLVSVGTRLARGESPSFVFSAFAAVFIGFGLSASWYLLARRATGGPSPRTVATYSVVIAACFGVLSGLTPT